MGDWKLALRKSQDFIFEAQEVNLRIIRMNTYSGKIFTTRLNCLDEKATGGRIPMDSTDEVLHWRLMGKTDQILNVVYDKPC